MVPRGLIIKASGSQKNFAFEYVLSRVTYVPWAPLKLVTRRQPSDPAIAPLCEFMFTQKSAPRCSQKLHLQQAKTGNNWMSFKGLMVSTPRQIPATNTQGCSNLGGSPESHAGCKKQIPRGFVLLQSIYLHSYDDRSVKMENRLVVVREVGGGDWWEGGA